MKVVSETTLAARETLATLTAKREAVLAKIETVNHRRAEIAYLGHTGDQAAADELEKLGDEATKLRHQAEDLARAIEVAKSKFESASMGDEMAEHRRQAAEALDLILNLRKHMTGLDKKAKDLAAGVQLAHDLARQIHALTGDAGTGEPFGANVRYALGAALHGILPGLATLAPSQRIGLAELGQRCTVLAENRARQILDRDTGVAA